jgi:membrane protease YdiL (CAAX protease family)
MLAMLDQVLMPGPDHAPIIEFFRSPGAAWLMFAFGVTFAPFFEEMFFRGFLLPALATAWDWAIEKSTGKPARPLDANGHPQWSVFAMVVASVLTTIPFALMHADQQGYSLGPFLLLITVSLILCAVRLATRSLAACTLVHACYNFLIFFTMMVGTGGFRHFDKM